MNFSKRAFTLSEVLITLVVIGVIAAITVPVMYNSYLKHETVTRLEKIYSEISQSVRMAESVHGSTSTWDRTLTYREFFDTYLSNYIKMSEEKLIDVKNQNNIVYKALNGNPEIYLGAMRDNADVINLASGAQLFLSRLNEFDYVGLGIAIDINGYKKPNKFGRDLFYGEIHLKDGQFILLNHNDDGSAAKNRDELKNGPSTQSYQCNKKGRGMWCGALIQADGWQIKDDYPW